LKDLDISKVFSDARTLAFKHRKIFCKSWIECH